MTKQQTQAETRLGDLDKMAKGQEGLSINALDDKARQLDDLLGPLQGQLAVQSNPGSKRDLEAKLQRLAADRAQKQAILDNPEASWAARILGECDEKMRESVLRVIHPGVLALPEGPEGVVVKNEGDLFQSLAELDRRVKDGIYEDKGLRVNLRSVQMPKDGVFDPILMGREIEALEAEEERLRHVLKDVSSAEALIREVKVLQESRNQALANVLSFQTWLKAEEARPELERLQREADDHLAVLETRRRDLSAEARELEEQIKEDQAMVASKRDQYRALRVEGEALGTQLDLNWDLPTLDPEVPILGPDEIGGPLEKYREGLRDALNHEDKVKRGIESLQKYLGSLLHGMNLGDVIKNLNEAMESLPERRDNLQKEKRALVEQAVRRFIDFYNGFKSVKSWIGGITRSLSEIQVSNLRSIQIVMAPTEQAGIIEKLVDAQESPLFAKDRVDEAVDRIVERMDERRVFSLREMFDLQIKVVRATGKEKLYKKLNGESTGTAMTLKVILMAMMLRELSKAQQNTSIRLPLFVDEADTLDDSNRTTILRTAEKLGFNVVMASPNAVPAHRVYFLHAVDSGRGERTRITMEDEHLTLEREAEEIVIPAESQDEVSDEAEEAVS